MSHRYQPPQGVRPHLDGEFMAYEPLQQFQQPYDAYDRYDRYGPRDSHARDPFPPEPRSSFRSPPRQHKSKSERRRRRAPSPVYYSDSPPTSSKRHGHGRSEYDNNERRGRSVDPARRRGPSPPPIIPEPEQSKKKSRSSRHERGAPRIERDSIYERDPRLSNPYEEEYYSREPASRHYPSEPRQRSFRQSEPDWSNSTRAPARDSLPEAQSRGRSSRHFDDGDDDTYMATRRRRPHSRTRGRQDRGPSGPSPTRGRPPPTQRARESTKRRSSMPATTKATIPWWQNPLIQAGARTALTAGAQAAMKSRKDQGEWLGAKGAKVATAALGAALVDGFIGQKHPNSVRENIAKQGVDLASGKVAAGSGRHSRHHHGY